MKGAKRVAKMLNPLPKWLLTRAKGDDKKSNQCHERQIDLAGD